MIGAHHTQVTETSITSLRLVSIAKRKPGKKMSSEQERQNNGTRGSLRLAPNVEELEEHKRKLPRQFVNFTFYRARPEWRMLDDGAKRECKKSFVNTVEKFRGPLLINSYSTVGLRTTADFMIWRIGSDLDPMQEMTTRLNQASMSKYLDATHSFLSMTKRSMYIEKNCTNQGEDHTHVVPGEGRTALLTTSFKF